MLDWLCINMQQYYNIIEISQETNDSHLFKVFRNINSWNKLRKYMIKIYDLTFSRVISNSTTWGNAEYIKQIKGKYIKCN